MAFYAFFLLISTDVFSQVQSSEDWLWNNEFYKNFNPNDEIIDRRTIDTKHFRNGNKDAIAVVAAGPINYFENNRWNTIYHTILPTSDGFQNLTNLFKSYYPQTSTGFVRTKFQNGLEIKEMQNMKMYYLDASGNKLSEMNIASKTGSVDFNELTYPQVYGNHIDLRLTQHSTMRKLDYVVKNSNAFSGVSTSAKHVVFEEVVELPSGWTASLVGNMIYLKNSAGVIQATYEKPVIRETIPPHHHHANGEEHHHDHEIEGKFELVHQAGNKVLIKTIVDMAWLTDSDRIFPLYIDPTGNYYPDNAAQWTGHFSLNGTSLTNYGTTTIGSRINEDMRLGRLDESTDKFLNSWAKFNLTAIPDNSIICNVRLNYTVYSTYSADTDCGTNVRIRHLANDPVSAGNAALLADIRDGDIFLTRNFGGNPVGSNGSKTTPNFANIQHVQNGLIPNWVGLGFEFYAGGPHNTCYVNIRGYAQTAKPFLIIDYSDVTGWTTVGYTAAANGTIPANPNCTNWSNTWCAGSGTFSQINPLTQGVNYTVENLGTTACGTAMPNAYMQAWAPGGTNCGRTPLGSPALNSFSFNAPSNGSYYFNVSTGLCASANTCGQYTGHDFTGQSAVLRYRQNTTVTNTTSNADICIGETKKFNCNTWWNSRQSNSSMDNYCWCWIRYYFG